MGAGDRWGRVSGDLVATTPERIRRWSDALAASQYQLDPTWVPKAVTTTGGVLVEGATEEQIAAAEQRLGIRLPPSYAAFLRISNGAYGGSSLQLCGSPFAPTDRAAVPTALLPVDQIVWARRSAAWLVDVMVDFPELLDHGGSTAFEGWGDGSEAAYLAVEDRDEPRMGHFLYALHIGRRDGTDEDVFLDPLTTDAAGEWQVLTVGNAASPWRSRSFVTWMEEATESLTTSVADPSPFDFMPSVMDVLWGPDVDAVAARLEAVLGDPEREVWFRRQAFHLLGYLEERDGVDRRSGWLLRFLRDPDFADMEVLGWMVRGDVESDELPSPGTVLAMDRPGDAEVLAGLSRAEVAGLVEEVGPDRLRGELVRRALPPHDSPAALLLVDLHRSGDLSGPLPAAGTTAPPSSIEVRDLLAAGDQLAVGVEPMVRALALLGHPSEAVARAEAALGDDGGLLYVMAELDSPEAWAALDRVADSRPFPLGWMSLVTAARTRSPLLVPRLRQILGDPQRAPLHPPARVALELHRSEAATEALRDMWSIGDLGALRALARLRDRTVTDDAVALLGDEDEPMRLAGARALRDLRDPSSAPPLLEAVSGRASDDLLVVVAHALAALQVSDAAPLLARVAHDHSDPQVVELLTRWSEQLAARG